MKYECGGCNFKTENEAEYKKHKLELGKAFKKAVMKGLRDIPEPQQNRSSKAHVVHPSPKEAQIKEQYDNTEPSGKAEQDAIKEAPDWQQRQPKQEDVIDTALLDMYQLGLQTGAEKPAPHKGICFNNKNEAKAAISQHIAEEKEKAVAHYREKITTGGRPLNAEPLVTKQPVPCPSCKTTHYYDWTLLPHQVYNSIIPGGVGHYCFPCFARKAIAEQVEAEKLALLEKIKGYTDEMYDEPLIYFVRDELAKLRMEAINKHGGK